MILYHIKNKYLVIIFVNYLKTCGQYLMIQKYKKYMVNKYGQNNATCSLLNRGMLWSTEVGFGKINCH